MKEKLNCVFNMSKNCSIDQMLQLLESFRYLNILESAIINRSLMVVNTFEVSNVKYIYINLCVCSSWSFISKDNKSGGFLMRKQEKKTQNLNI